MQQTQHPESQPRPAPPGPQVSRLDEAGVRQILSIALRFGQLLLSCQAGTADVSATITAVTTAYGLPGTQVDITANAITVSVPRWVPGAPVTAMYLVQSRSLDYTRLQMATDLAQRVVDTAPDPAWVREQLQHLEQAEHPYPRWVSTVALGVMAGGFSVLLGAGVYVAVLATATTAAIDRIGRVLNRRRLPFLFQQIVAAALATGVAIGVGALGWLPEGTPMAPVVAANIVALLSGLAIVGSFQDAVTGYQLTAVSRMMDIALSSAGILVGITIALHIGAAAGVHVHVTPAASIAILGLPVRVLAGAIGAAAAAVAGYARPRAAVAAGAAGAIGSLLFFGLQLAGADNITSSFGAAAAIGLGAAISAVRLRVTPLVIVMAGIVPLVPGLTLFQGFVRLVNGQSAGGSLGMAAAIALALGAGVVLGPLLAPSAHRELARLRVLRGGTIRRIPQLAGIRLPSQRWATVRRGRTTPGAATP